MEPTLWQYIRRYSWREQIFLLVLTCLSFPFLYQSLELPKIIVNQAIADTGFPKTIHGFELQQVEYLAILCGLFLLLVGVNGAFKYYINVYKGRLGERMLRRLRYQLFAQTLRFPLPHFRRTSQGEVIAMITSEVEPLGGFIGDAVAQPAFQGGTLLTILGFMFAQDMVLGLAAIALYPLQMWLIPRLQRQVNLLAKERVRTVRRLAERIGEGISGIEEIHGNDASEWHRADFSRWVGTIYGIRLKIYRKKFFIKFLNNFIAQLTPFFFYSIGGYLVIRGDLTFGALVAVLAAYKDLSSPWKELLDWYQQKEDTRIKYDQLVEQFFPVGLMPESMQAPVEGEVGHLTGTVVASNLTLEDDAGIRTVDGAAFSFEIGERVTLLGPPGSGTDSVARLLARLVQPTAGSILVGGRNLANLPEAVTGRRLAYVGAHVALVSGSIRDNLFYGVRHWPLRPAPGESEADARRRREFADEADKTGNTASDPGDDWIDLAGIGIDGPESLARRVREVLVTTELEADLFALGLRKTVDPATRGDLVKGILVARRALRGRLREPRYRGLVEGFERDRYNRSMTVAENLLFGLPVGDEFDLDRLGDHPYVQRVLVEVDLHDEFLSMGLRVAKIMLDLFQDLPPGHEFFERFSFIRSEDLSEYQAAIRGVEATGLSRADAADRSLLSSLPFRLVPARHRLGLIDEAVERRLLRARQVFAEQLPEALRDSVAFFDPEGYNVAASVQDNILFGKLVYGRQQAQREIGAMIAEIVDELGLRAEIADRGLDFGVGVGGSRLSGAQRQKLAIARALLKAPDLLVLDNATAALDASGRAAILDRLLRRPSGSAGESEGEKAGGLTGGLVWTTSDPERADDFDRVIVMEAGRVVEQGTAKDVLGPVPAPRPGPGPGTRLDGRLDEAPSADAPTTG